MKPNERFQVSSPRLILTLEQAMIRQSEAAIRALIRGEYDVALTLAGAAEGMIEREASHLFAVLRDDQRAKQIPKREWIATLNGERDWLKHGGRNQMSIGRFEAALMIARSLSTISDWTPLMEEFRTWFTANLNELAQDDAEK
jgi:hypothetical protein